MTLTLSKKDICGKTRYHTNCDQCGNLIIIDGDIFGKHPTSINCHLCKIQYIILSINNLKHKLELKVTAKRRHE